MTSSVVRDLPPCLCGCKGINSVHDPKLACDLARIRREQTEQEIRQKQKLLRNEVRDWDAFKKFKV